MFTIIAHTASVTRRFPASSPGSAGTAVAQAHLRGILGYLGMTVMGAPETCVPWRDGILSDPATRDYLTAFLDALNRHVSPPVTAGRR